MILPEYQTSDSVHHFASVVGLVFHSSNFHHWPLLALLVALVLHKGERQISILLSYSKIIGVERRNVMKVACF